MDSERPSALDRLSRTPVVTSAFALAYVSIGVGFVYGIVADSMPVLVGTFAATIAVVVGSIAVLARREGVFTAENELIGGFVLAALALLFVLSAFTEAPSEVVFAVVFAVGVLVPGLLLQYTDYGRDA